MKKGIQRKKMDLISLRNNLESFTVRAIMGGVLEHGDMEKRGLLIDQLNRGYGDHW